MALPVLKSLSLVVSKDAEHKIQSAFFEYVSYYPIIRDCIFAIPNGGHRHVAVGAKLKREGVKKGVADVFVSIPAHNFHGMYIEFKYGSNKQTVHQKCFEETVRAHGYEYKVCYSLDEAINLLKEYLLGSVYGEIKSCH